MGTKISALTTTGSAPADSYIPIAYDGDNYKISPANFVGSSEISFQVTRASAQVLTHSVTSTLGFDDEVIASSSFDTSTHRFTPGVAGRYFLSWTLRTSAGSAIGYINGGATVSLRKNNTLNVFNQYFALASSFGYATSSFIVEANDTDYFTLKWTPPGGLYPVTLASSVEYSNFGGFSI